MTASPALNPDDGQSTTATPPKRRKANGPVIRLAINGAVYLTLLLVAVALTASSTGAEDVARIFSIDVDSADAYVKAAALLLTVGLLDYFQDLMKLSGPRWVFGLVVTFNRLLAYAMVAGAGAVLAVYLDEVAAWAGAPTEAIRNIAAAVGLLYLIGTYFISAEIRDLDVEIALEHNGWDWETKIEDNQLTRENDINLQLAEAGIGQNGVEGVTVLAERHIRVEAMLCGAGIDADGDVVAGVAELIRRAELAKTADAVAAQ